MTLRHRTRIAVAAAALLAVSTLAACSSDDTDEPTDPASEPTESSESAEPTPAAGECPFEPEESVDLTVRVAVRPVAGADLVIREQQLLEACLPNATIEWQDLPSGDAVTDAIAEGEAEVGAADAEALVRAVAAEQAVSALWIHDASGADEDPPRYDLAVADTAFVEENPELMTVWARLQEEVGRQFREEPQRAAEGVAAQLDVEVGEAQDLVERLVTVPAAEQIDEEHLGGALATDLGTIAQALVAAGEIPAAGDEGTWQQAVDSRPAGAAAQ